jgi:hypothetical protein
MPTDESLRSVRRDGHEITRRAALKCLAGAAGLAAGARTVRAADAPATQGAATAPTSRPALLERQSSGSEIWQITTEPFHQSNIYCEVPWCSRDSRHFVYLRSNPAQRRDTTELLVVELGTWKQYRLDTAVASRGYAITPDGIFYYFKRNADGSADLMKVDLNDGSPRAVYRMENGEDLSALRSHGTVSVDHRYWLAGKSVENQKHLYGILLIDLQKGTRSTIDRDPYVFNAHPQFNPADPHQVMIQLNRGGIIDPDSGKKQSTGPEGATLYLLSVPDGKRTPLPVGRPDTTPITGHEAWIGTSGEIVLSVEAGGDFSVEKGTLLRVRPGEPARILANRYRYNHVAASRCGRFFCCDDWKPPYKIVIGSVRTGRTTVVCESKSSGGKAQNTHPHAYLTPDLKWVIFNSDRNGFPHVHAASVPEDLIKDLSKA